MIALDTNVVVRLLTGDDPAQARRAALLVARGACLVPKTVLLESEWVLRHAYGFGPSAICKGLRKLLGLESVSVEDSDAVKLALAWHASGMDFADALHLASSRGAKRLVTFDRAFARTAARLGLPKVDAI